MDIKPQDIQFRVGDNAWIGLETLSVSRDLNSAASAFSAGGVPLVLGNGPISIYDPVQIIADGVPVFTGILDDLDASCDGDSGFLLGLSGRSKTGLLVDCTATPKVYTYSPPMQIVRDIAGSFGIVTDAAISDMTLIERFTVPWGERAFDAIDRLARNHGFLVTDNAKGRLMFCRADNPTDGGRLNEDTITRIRYTLSGASRYYQTIGQVEVQDKTDHSAFLQATSYDDGCDAIRRRHVSLSDVFTAKQLKEALDWQAATDLAQSVQLNIDVEGWFNSTGALWAPNQLVLVSYPPTGLEKTLLVYSVGFNLDGSPTTSLSLAPQAGFLLMEPKKTPDALKEMGLPTFNLPAPELLTMNRDATKGANNTSSRWKELDS